MPPPDIRNLRRIVSRKEWGAKPPKEQVLMPTPVPYVLFSITETQACKSLEECIDLCQKMQQEHMALGLPDIMFNFMIGDDLNVYEGRGWNVEPSVDDKKYLDKKGRLLQIAYLGEYEKNFPSLDVFDVRDALVEYGFAHKHLDKRYFLQPR